VSSAPTAVPERRTATPMALLANGVPLSLLLDLAFGPRSEDLLRDEVPSLPGPRSDEA
jgi:hypothetical protein